MSLILVDEQFISIAKGLIETAKKSIFLSTFKAEISHHQRGKALLEFFELIAKKSKEGLKIKLLINWHDDRKSVPKTNEYAIKFCKENQIKVRHLKFNRCNHAKIIIIDNEKAIVGSHNLSIRSINNNFELSCLLVNEEDVRPIIETYQKVWDNGLKA